MSRTTFFNLNRYLILVGICCCFLLPFIEITIHSEPIIQSPLRTLEEFIMAPESASADTETFATPLDIDITGEIYSPTSFGVSGFLKVFGFVYFTGIIAMICYLYFSYSSVFRLIRSSEKTKIGNIIFVKVKESICSFNWGNYIVISEKDYDTHPEILKHEEAHCNLRHTGDLMFLQMMTVLFWFNPVVWLLRKELKEIHEFQADNTVINKGVDVVEYQLLLVKKYVGTRLYSMASGFNHNKLKNRIEMIQKRKTKRMAQLRLIFFVPVVACVVYAFAQPQLEQLTDIWLPTVEQEISIFDFAKTFNSELKAYEETVWGKKLDSRERKEKYINNMLMMNAKGAIMLNGEISSVDKIKNDIIKTLKISENTSSKGKDINESPVLTILWDTATDQNDILNLLKIVRSVSAGHPILVFMSGNGFDSLRAYEEIDDVIITLVYSQESQVELTNFTLSELETKVKEFAQANTNGEGKICFKVQPDTKMGVITDIKEVISTVYKEFPALCPF